MVTVRHKTTIDASMFARRQALTHSLTTFRTILRRVGWIHLDYYTASLFRFARENQDELIPACVTDALCQMMVLHHPFHVQFFDSNRIELPHDLERRLVMKVGPLPPNLLMLLGE
jgi:hypothetical protein